MTELGLQEQEQGEIEIGLRLQTFINNTLKPENKQ